MKKRKQDLSNNFFFLLSFLLLFSFAFDRSTRARGFPAMNLWLCWRSLSAFFLLKKYENV